MAVIYPLVSLLFLDIARVLCERFPPGEQSHVCASSEGQICTCNGTAVFIAQFVDGKPGAGATTNFSHVRGAAAHDHLSVMQEHMEGASIKCSADPIRGFGEDPAFGYHKHCLCVTPSWSPDDPHPVQRISELTVTGVNAPLIRPLRSLALATADARPSRKVVLLGPHDRFNFGDLLFEKVVRRLLVKRAGFADHNLLTTGLAPVNMSFHGGNPQIFSVKQVQEMSHSSEGGPFDIVYLGGQAVSCTHSCGVRMLPTQALRTKAKEHKVFDCAYLFPKSGLVNLSNPAHANATNFAVVNSLGGRSMPGHPCHVAIATADYLSFRDLPPGRHPASSINLPSGSKEVFGAPDSAVMVKQLFGGEIAHTPTPLPLAVGQYIAVQHQADKLLKRQYRSLLCKVLDEIAVLNNCTIVFFAAGTVPRHDSLDMYQELSKGMRAPSFVFREKNVWSVVALISRAKAVMATSLHVRIMAFIFLKPRVSWCKRRKPDAKMNSFMEIWEAPNYASECTQLLPGHRHATARLLQQAMSAPTEPTRLAVANAVGKYLAHFDVWSGILINRNP